MNEVWSQFNLKPSLLKLKEGLNRLINELV